MNINHCETQHTERKQNSLLRALQSMEIDMNNRSSDVPAPNHSATPPPGVNPNYSDDPNRQYSSDPNQPNQDARNARNGTTASAILGGNKNHNPRISTGFDTLATHVAALNALVAKLQNSTGAATPEDQATIDQLQADGAALQTDIEAIVAAVSATPNRPVS